MEIATESGRQLINRSGFGIDISNDGMLGIVRQVPLAEINAILAPPTKKEESKSGDSEVSSDENGEESAEAEEEGEDTAWNLRLRATARQRLLPMRRLRANLKAKKQPHLTRHRHKAKAPAMMTARLTLPLPHRSVPRREKTRLR